MKILHIIPNLRKGGAERLVIDIVRSLKSVTKIEIKLILFENKIEYQVDDLLSSIEVVPSSLELSVLRKNKVEISKLQQAIEDFNPEIIHTHLFQAELVTRFCNYPKAIWFSHVHDNMVQFKNWSWSSITKSNITNSYEKQVIFKQYKKNGGTHFIAISKHTESFIKSVQSRYPATLLHNAIDVKRFQKSACYNESTQNGRLSPVEVYHPVYRKNESRSPLTTNHSQLTINLINIGSFVPKKNQSFLIDILLELNKKGIQTSFFFLGDGPLKIEVENRAKELGISEQCHFFGNVENVEEYLWQSDVYVHSAIYEPLGLVLLEAMAAGLPVITLNGGGNRDLIEEGKNGFLIEDENVEYFTEKILELVNNQTLFKDMSQYAQLFAQKFDIVPYVDNLLKLYKKES